MLFDQKCTIASQATNKQPQFEDDIISWSRVVGVAACDFVIWSEYEDSKVCGIHFLDENIDGHSTRRKDSGRRPRAWNDFVMFQSVNDLMSD